MKFPRSIGPTLEIKVAGKSSSYISSTVLLLFFLSVDMGASGFKKLHTQCFTKSPQGVA